MSPRDAETALGPPRAPRPEDVPMHVPKPWGYELWWAWTEDYVGKILFVAKGHKLSVQYHEHKDETSYLQRGRLLLHKGSSLEDLTVGEMGPGASWRNAPATSTPSRRSRTRGSSRSPRPSSTTWSASRTATGARAPARPERSCPARRRFVPQDTSVLVLLLVAMVWVILVLGAVVLCVAATRSDHLTRLNAPPGPLVPPR